MNLNQFRNPDSDFRGLLFWAWNGELEESELRHQIRTMKRMGLGGFFMHSRVGLKTPYLSGAWFDAIRACVDEATKCGMKSWLYDEDRWPSGFAGGLVTRNSRYRRRFLFLDREDSDKGTTVFRCAVKFDNDRIIKVLPLEDGEPPPISRVVLRFACAVDEPESWYNGQTALDSLNPRAVKSFIDTTHEAYRREVGKFFGKQIPGIFTDEPAPHRRMINDKNTLPWTDRLPKEYQKFFGEDVFDILPSLFFEVEGRPVERDRWRFHECVTRLFVESFSAQIGSWCGKNELMFTGHIYGEDSLRSQSSGCGSAMRFYRHMQIPGVDILSSGFREYDTPLQVASVARQLGRACLSETYGATGWDFSFEGHKAVSDWQAALGIDMRCLHLGMYTMEGQTKRDYPASILHQSPWWSAYRKVEDYFARISSVLRRGRDIRDILLIHPIESAWTRIKPGWMNDDYLDKMERDWVKLRDRLIQEQLNFDYGEESLIEEMGRIGRTGDSTALRIGEGVYTVVVVPNCVTLRRSTLEILQAFQSRGGVLVFLDEIPAMIEGETSYEMVELAKESLRFDPRKEAIPGQIERFRKVEILDESKQKPRGLLYRLTEDRNNFYLFISSTGSRPAKDDEWILKDLPLHERRLDIGKVKIRCFKGCTEAPIELDPEEGGPFQADAKLCDNGEWEIKTELHPLGSRLFTVAKKPGLSIQARRKRPKVSESFSLGNLSSAPILTEPNVLVLDRVRWKTPDKKWSDPTDVLDADRQIRKMLGMPNRGERMAQPWTVAPGRRGPKFDISVQYLFKAKSPVVGPVQLGVENPKGTVLSVNGLEIDGESDHGCWTDASLRLREIPPAAIHEGNNFIQIDREYNQDFTGLEASVLLGQFSVGFEDGFPFICRLNPDLQMGDWTVQGFPFYSGGICYPFSFKTPKHKSTCYLRVSNFEGSCVRVWLNGNLQGIVGWAPWMLPLNNLTSIDCDNNAVIEVVSHRRNSHGPLHHKETRPVYVSPGLFEKDQADWTDDYILIPCGLYEAPELLLSN